MTATWMAGGAFCNCGRVEFMVPSVPCVRVGHLAWDGQEEGETLRWMQHTPVDCEWVDLLSCEEPAAPKVTRRLCACAECVEEKSKGEVYPDFEPAAPKEPLGVCDPLPGAGPQTPHAQGEG